MFCDINTREIKKYFKSKHLEKQYSPRIFLFYIPILRYQLDMNKDIQLIQRSNKDNVLFYQSFYEQFYKFSSK